ncbi:MAG: lipoyl synthase [Pseudomonadota bacterium]|nr:lipoyl synthase [Pseudomonadota bacterium]
MIDPSQKQRAADKLSRIPVKIEAHEPLPKPDWIRVRLPNNDNAAKLKHMLRDKKIVTVCEEAACPNLPECFGHGTATFMIMGDRCTRRCTFCDVAHGRPEPLDPLEPKNVAESTLQMGLRYVVITSVDRDDLRDGGAEHFAKCIREVRASVPNIKIEILVPDFRGRMEKALDALAEAPADVFNHNIETVARLYKAIRPGSDYQWSLTLLQQHKLRFPAIPTKSGIMVGLGETDEEIIEVLRDLRKHNVEMLTIGQYLAPSRHHAPVTRYVTPKQFDEYAAIAKQLGFTHAASGPLVRSSYHADKQAAGEKVS